MRPEHDSRIAENLLPIGRTHRWISGAFGTSDRCRFGARVASNFLPSGGSPLRIGVLNRRRFRQGVRLTRFLLSHRVRFEGGMGNIITIGQCIRTAHHGEQNHEPPQEDGVEEDIRSQRSFDRLKGEVRPRV